MSGNLDNAVARRTRTLGRQRFRPSLECLEDRTLPSTLTVVNLHDHGAGSLRSELAQAHDGDTIIFAPHLHGTITLTSGELEVGKSVTIQGPGAGCLAVDGNHASRVFEILDGADLTLSGLTITDGLANPAGSVSLGGSGGGIYVDRGATLRLIDSDVKDNTANAASVTGGYNLLVSGSGGGIYNAGTLTLVSDVIARNTANVGLARASSFSVSDGQGGGIYNAGIVTGRDDRIDDNTASAAGAAASLLDVTTRGEGGGVYNAGSFQLADSAIDGNTADAGCSAGAMQGSGGGIDSTGDLTLRCVSVSRDVANAGSVVRAIAAEADGYGGGLYVSGRAEVEDGRFISDVANAGSATAVSQQPSFAVTNGWGGGVYNSGAVVTVRDSVFFRDVADAGSAADATEAENSGYGGAMYNGEGTLTVEGSTLADDTANAGAAVAPLTGFSDDMGSGGGIASIGTLTVRGSFLFGDVANAGAAVSQIDAIGGGIFAANQATVDCSLIVANSVNTSAGLLPGSTFLDTVGGGIDAESGGAGGLTLNHTVVAGNRSLQSHSDIGGQVDPRSADNLIGDGGSGGLVNGVNGNVVL